MKNALSAIVLIIFIFASGQGRAQNAPFSKEVIPIDSVAWADIAYGFYTGNGFGALSYHLDSNNTFKMVSSDCVSRFTIDSGVWIIKKKVLTLKSKSKTLLFYVFKFDNFNFYLLPEQKNIFLKDLQEALETYKNFKGTFIGDRKFTVKDIVGYLLISCYYGRDITDLPGT